MNTLLKLLKKYSYVLVFLMLEALAILLLNNHNYYQHSRILNTQREITAYIYDKVDGSKEYLSLKKTNEILVRENSTLRNILSDPNLNKTDLTKAEVQRLSHYTPARIVHSTVFKQLNYLTINKGRKQGVMRDMAVISEEGIVGIVLASSLNFSTILPIINRDFRLSTKIKKNNFTGILLWDGASPQQAVLNEIPYHAEIQIGDTVITSGFSAIFPEGLHVGTISDFSLKEGNFYNIHIQLATDFNNLFHVNVIKNYLQEEQRELEEKVTE